MRQFVNNRSRFARRAARAAVRTVAIGLASLLVSACGASEAAVEPAGDSNASMAVEEALEPLPAPPSAAPRDDPLEGTWWVFLPSLPYMAFRANLTAPDPSGDVLDGSWVSFDWRRTSDSGSLARLSKRVAIRATRDGDRLTIEGPAPMLDADGNPNGHSGLWLLRLRQVGLAGETSRYSGRSRHDKLTEESGTPADLVREFRPWKKP